MNPKVRIRISDNVLGDEDWNIYELELRFIRNAHVVIRQTLEQNGVYSQDFLGLMAEQVRDWAAYDPTGSHPEVWHEIWSPKEEKWVSLISMADFIEIMGFERPGEGDRI